MFGSLGGLSAFGGHKGIAGMLGKQKDPGKAQLAQILAQYRLMQGQQRSIFASAQQQQQKGLRAVEGGYKNALATIGNTGYQAKQNVLGREQQNLGSMRAGLESSGLQDTTLGANLSRAVYRDTNRDLSQIDEMLAGMRSSLEAQRGMAQAGQYGALAGLLQGQSGQQTALGQSLIGTLGSVQHTDPNAWMAGLVQGGMNLLPFLGGGPAGAAYAGGAGAIFPGAV